LTITLISAPSRGHDGWALARRIQGLALGLFVGRGIAGFRAQFLGPLGGVGPASSCMTVLAISAMQSEHDHFQRPPSELDSIADCCGLLSRGTTMRKFPSRGDVSSAQPSAIAL